MSVELVARLLDHAKRHRKYGSGVEADLMEEAAKALRSNGERSAGGVDVTDEMIERFTDALYDTPGDEILECDKDTAVRLLTAALSPRADSAGGA